MIVAAAALALTACDEPLDQAVPDNESAVEKGEAIYMEHCAACHGENLEGQPNWDQPDLFGKLPAPPHDDTGETWMKSDSILFYYIENGGGAIVPVGVESNMPAFRDVLSEDQIWKVISFIKSRWSPMARARQKGMNTR